jgi:hypothetical protein
MAVTVKCFDVLAIGLVITSNVQFLLGRSGPPPQLNAVPPPLPSELRVAKGTDPRIIAVAAVVGFVPLLAVLGKMAKEPRSTAPSVASSSSQFTATPAEHFPRAIPVPSGLDGFFSRIKCLDVTSILKHQFSSNYFTMLSVS